MPPAYTSTSGSGTVGSDTFSSILGTRRWASPSRDVFLGRIILNLESIRTTK